MSRSRNLDRMTRYQWFESGFLQRGVMQTIGSALGDELSVADPCAERRESAPPRDAAENFALAISATRWPPSKPSGCGSITALPSTPTLSWSGSACGRGST